MFAKVVVDIAYSNIFKAFTYSVPEDIKLSVGMRVEVPFGRQKLFGVVVDLIEESDIDASKLKPILRTIESYPAILPELITLSKQMAQESHASVADTLRLMLPAEMRRGTISVKQDKYYSITPKALESLDELIQKYGSTRKKGLILALLADGSTKTAKDLCEYMNAPYDALKTLEAEGYIKSELKEVFRHPYSSYTDSATDPELMPQQKDALNIIEEERSFGRRAFLLHGVTGSGKTEVYIRLVQSMLKKGKGVIILVPEISLTPQMVRWFKERFHDAAAVMHSRLSAGERYDEWRRVRLGDARLVIGARSAIFAPVENLGLIVVDEEHESTYQSDRFPQYDARHVAELRANNENAMYLLASATPSVNSFARALNGELCLVEMPKRVMNRPLPKVTVVDMCKELQSGNSSMFSTLLLSKIDYHLTHGNQIMLFLNRRGHSTFVSCRNCGYVIKCDNCDISMCYHSAYGYEKESIKCHICGATKPLPKRCPSCGSPYIRYFGGGTQKVEEELKKKFPGVKTLRMDFDTTSTKNAHEKILDSFRSGEAQVLIGTQMITKGLDFPNVTLVGVVSADITLFLPDYRAPERTFQLLTQVAGRAGRADNEGEVVIQTYKPNHPIIEDAAAQDFRAFFTKEIDRRKTGFYPPFTQIVRLLFEGKYEKDTEELCSKLFNELKAYIADNPRFQKHIIMYHKDEAGVKRIKNKYRFHILLKLFKNDEIEELKTFIEGLSHQDEKDINIFYEVDPLNMM